MLCAPSLLPGLGGDHLGPYGAMPECFLVPTDNRHIYSNVNVRKIAQYFEAATFLPPLSSTVIELRSRLIKRRNLLTFESENRIK